VAMRFSKRLHELSEALVYFFEFGLGAIFGPASPARPQFNLEGSWRFRPSGWFFHVRLPG
jgi:hypothetical protein